jgi:pimeloyl-ACP methyl ester carboxylesterase
LSQHGSQYDADLISLVKGLDHSAYKATPDGPVRLFLREKPHVAETTYRGTILFVHGSSWASLPTFDLYVRGRPFSSVMDWFAARGFDCWCLDSEGYGLSDKHRPINCGIENGADDIVAATDYILKVSGVAKFMLYGISSGALKAALFTERHPERVARLALDAFVWTGEGSPTLVERRKNLPKFLAANRRPYDRAMIQSVFDRDHPGTADQAMIDAFAQASLAQDSSVPTGTYVDMCTKLPMVDPTRIPVPTIMMRGEYDGIAAVDDLIEFFKRLPNTDKQFAMMPGVAHASFQQTNYLLVYGILHAFFTQIEPVFRSQ